MSRLARRRGLLLAAVAVAGLCPRGSAAAPQTHTVVIDHLRFEPATLEVRVGDTVVWANRDLVPHTVTAAGVLDSGSIAPQTSWKHVMTKAGTLGYVCTFHPTMKGTLQVK